MKRTLTLKSETLAELTTADLTQVVGAEALPSGLSCPVNDCQDMISLIWCPLAGR